MLVAEDRADNSAIFSSIPNSMIINSHRNVAGGSNVTTINYDQLKLHTSDLESDTDEILDRMMGHNVKESHSSPEQSPLTSPGLLSPGLRTPSCDTYQDTNTQMSLVEVSSKLNIGDDTNISAVDVDSSHLWGMVDADHAEAVNHDQSRKAHKACRKSDAASCVHSETEEEMAGFDAHGAISTSQFVFHKFGADVTSSSPFVAASGDPGAVAAVAGATKTEP